MRSDFSLYTPSGFKQVMVLLSKKFLLFLLDCFVFVLLLSLNPGPFAQSFFGMNASRQ